MTTTVWPAATWVQIETVVLTPEQRAPQVPADTAAVPLVMRAKGWLQAPAAIGEQVSVQTVIGRTLTGTLLHANPPNQHGFGRPVPELLTIGRELRQRLWGRS
jgi:hypothetical protein